MFTREFIPSTNYDMYFVEYGKGDSCPIDQSPVQEFNIDPDTGRPMSDITKIMRAESQYEKDKLYNDLKLHPDETGMLEDKDVLNSLKYACPRLSQLPSELADYAESLTERRINEAKDKMAKHREKIDNLTSDEAYKVAEEYFKAKENERKRKDLEKELDKIA